MKAKELVWTALAYVVSIAVGIPLLWKFWPGHVELAWALAAIVGTNVAAMFYHRRLAEKAPLSAKAVAGAVLAACAVPTGLLAHVLLHPFKFVEVSIPIATIGSFVFPFVLFGTMQQAYSKQHQTNGKQDKGPQGPPTQS
jgi:hypothetical protein